ncbi:MAG TPA: type I-MYXAN CRISPR-associated protein Cas6/Cmx6 [Burkholderiales bacterium]
MTYVDIAYAVEGGPLPRDHSFDLWRALSGVAPELFADPTVAVLPVRGASAGAGGIVLQRRSRLLMRLPEASVDAALGLCGARLDVAGALVALGDAKSRPLAPYATLYAYRVAAERDDEESFVKQAAAELGRIDVAADFIVGKRSVTRGAAGDIAGYSLMLAELSARQSLALQVHGLGAHRGLGFGIFVGHK